VSPDFTAVDARARGLSAHLFTRPELEALAGADALGVARALAHSPRLTAPVSDAASPVELERAVRRTASQHLRTLSRWAGAAPVLGVYEAQQDRRSLRALIRGALATAPAEERLAGLLPTPTLPERVLTELARQPTPAAVVAHLFALRHPDAGRLAELTAAAQPDLLALEQALARGEAERATREAARGDANLRRHVALHIDAVNAQTALLLPRHGESPLAGNTAQGPFSSPFSPSEVEGRPPRSTPSAPLDSARGERGPLLTPSAEVEGRPPRDSARGERTPWFLEGGAVLSPTDFLEVVAAPKPAVRLRELLAPTALAELVMDPALDAGRLERAAFSRELEAQRVAAREAPLSSAPLLSFLLRLEAMARDLRRILWGAALGAPATVIISGLVTP